MHTKQTSCWEDDTTKNHHEGEEVIYWCIHMYLTLYSQSLSSHPLLEDPISLVRLFTMIEGLQNIDTYLVSTSIRTQGLQVRDADSFEDLPFCLFDFAVCLRILQPNRADETLLRLQSLHNNCRLPLEGVFW